MGNTKTSKNKEAIDLFFNYIMEDRLKPGDKIDSEEVLTERFNVSRVALREALQGLKFLGMLKSHTKRGTVLRGIDFSMLCRGLNFHLALSDISYADLLQARLLMELGAVEMLCGKLKKKQIQEMRNLARCSMLEETPEEVRRTHELDMRFHVALLNACGNVIVNNYSLLLNIFFARICPDSTKEIMEEAERSHIMLVDALESGNLDMARGIVKRHLSTYRG